MTTQPDKKDDLMKVIDDAVQEVRSRPPGLRGPFVIPDEVLNAPERPATTQPETPVAWRMGVMHQGGKVNWYFAEAPLGGGEPVFTADAIDAAYRRGIEDAAQVAWHTLKDEAADLFAICESYIEAKKSGTHNGRRIKAKDADLFAKPFRERADAVNMCANHVAAAIRAKAGE